MALTAKEKRFADEYLIDLNAVQAAIRAGYSAKTAERASDWINEKGQEKSSSKYKPELKDYIDEQLAKINSEKIADAQEVMEYLTSVMRGESESEEIVTEFLGDGISKARPKLKHPSEKDKLRAAELIGRRLGIFKDKVEVSGSLKAETSKLDELVKQLTDDG